MSCSPRWFLLWVRFMKKIFITVFAFCVAISAARAATEEGFVSLMDGKTFISETNPSSVAARAAEIATQKANTVMKIFFMNRTHSRNHRGEQDIHAALLRTVGLKLC